MDIFSSKLPVFTMKSLCFYWNHFTSTIYVTSFAAGLLKMKLLLLIDAQICTYSLADQNLPRSLCGICLFWGQVGYISYFNLKFLHV